MKRREFITLLGAGVGGWPRAARAQQAAMPVVALINSGTPESGARYAAAFRSALAEAGRVEGQNVAVEYHWLEGRNDRVPALINSGTPESGARYAAAFRSALAEAGRVEGQNVAVEYHWLEGRNDRVPALITELVRRRVAVIATPGFSAAAVAARAATSTIPIVFGTGEDPVRLGLVTNLARPAGNATGINFFVQELTAKRLGLFHDLVPKATRIALLLNPANVQGAESTLQGLPEAARALGLETEVLKASTSREIDAAFATLVRNRIDALLIAGGGFFTSRRSQFVMLSARDGIATSAVNRDLA